MTEMFTLEPEIIIRKTVLFNSVQEWLAGYFWPFGMFTQSIEFYYYILLRRAYSMKFFFHRWLNLSFDSFLSTFNTCIQLPNVNEIFQSTIMKVFQKKNFLPDFWQKFFLLKYISRIKDQIFIENDVNNYVRWTRKKKWMII